ncbi:MAG TPA: hypothetical protein VLA19_09505 [Herpetosiphonaceae bacterium]|nr:hypothetical protein [Herpetosiphonaceae bacterium]
MVGMHNDYPDLLSVRVAATPARVDPSFVARVSGEGRTPVLRPTLGRTGAVKAELRRVPEAALPMAAPLVVARTGRGTGREYDA